MAQAKNLLYFSWLSHLPYLSKDSWPKIDITISFPKNLDIKNTIIDLLEDINNG